MGWGCEFDEDIILTVKNIHWRAGYENTFFCSKQFRRSRSLKDKFQEEHFRRTGKGENTFSFQLGYIIDGDKTISMGFLVVFWDPKHDPNYIVCTKHKQPIRIYHVALIIV